MKEVEEVFYILQLLYTPMPCHFVVSIMALLT
jgi:hypothetical protein